MCPISPYASPFVNVRKCPLQRLTYPLPPSAAQHPGNLLRTADGKIVILDFGLMTEVTEDQRVALIEFIAHLTMEDWKGVSKDLLSLG